MGQGWQRGEEDRKVEVWIGGMEKREMRRTRMGSSDISREREKEWDDFRHFAT